MEFEREDSHVMINSHSGWSEEKALTEIITNSIDEHRRLSLPIKDIIIRTNDKYIQIEDSGEGIHIDCFRQGYTTKSDSLNESGKYGDGLCGSCATLLRLGFSIAFDSSKMRGYIDVSPNGEIYINHTKPLENIVGTLIHIEFPPNYTKASSNNLWKQIRKRIIAFGDYGNPIDRVEYMDDNSNTCYANIYMPLEGDSGSVFYKGVYIPNTDKTNIRYVYDFEFDSHFEDIIRSQHNVNRTAGYETFRPQIHKVLKSSSNQKLRTQYLRDFKLTSLIKHGKKRSIISKGLKYSDIGYIHLYDYFESSDTNWELVDFATPKYEKITFQITEDIDPIDIIKEDNTQKEYVISLITRKISLSKKDHSEIIDIFDEISKVYKINIKIKEKKS